MVTGALEPPLLRFGVFDLDPKTGELRKGGVHIKLQPQPCKVLTLLASRAGELVTREEIRQAIWGQETFVDFEQGLNFCIKQIRTALGDDPEAPRYVETLARRGYRFIAPVRAVDAKDVAGTTKPAEATPATAPARSRLLGLTVIALGLALVLIVAYYQRHSFGRGTPLPVGKIMLAVLPFGNLTGDAGQDYFSDGLTEEMITQLGRMNPERLGVIARTSAMQYKNTQKRTDQIGRELGVDYILEGSVRRTGDRVRVSAQLIQVKEQTHLWAQSYERDLRDVLVLQNDVAHAIASEIEIKLTPQQQARLAIPRPVNPEAYEVYLKGRFFWNKRTGQGYKKAIEYFRQAIARDPNYAHAYAGLADAYALLGSISNDQISRSEAMARARTAALKALELDDTLAEALTSLAFVRMHYDWDWTGAEREFQRAIKLNPAYATARHWHAYCLLAQGRGEEALREIRLAEESDPLSLIIKTDVAEILYFARHYDEAIAQARRALDMDPNFFLAHRALGWAFVQKRHYAEAIAELQEGLRLEADRGDLLLYLAYAYARAGQDGEARRTLARVKHPEASFEVVAVYVALGGKDAAFSWLEKGFKEHSGLTVFLRTAPEYDPLRSDPRFADLLRRVGLPQ